MYTYSREATCIRSRVSTRISSVSGCVLLSFQLQLATCNTTPKTFDLRVPGYHCSSTPGAVVRGSSILQFFVQTCQHKTKTFTYLIQTKKPKPHQPPTTGEHKRMFFSSLSKPHTPPKETEHKQNTQPTTTDQRFPHMLSLTHLVERYTWDPGRLATMQSPMKQQFEITITNQ